MKYIVKEIEFKKNTPVDAGGKIIYVEKILLGIYPKGADYRALCLIEVQEGDN